VFQCLNGQAEVCRWAEHRSGQSDLEVGLPQMRTVGADRIDQVDAVIDDQGNSRATQNRQDLTAETNQLIVGGVHVAQLHHRDSGADCR
jgi:hypothetical protein